MTHLPLPTSHSDIHEPPSIGDSLLCTALRSVVGLEDGRKKETEWGDMRFLLLLGFDLPSPIH